MTTMSAREFAEWRWLLGETSAEGPSVDREAQHTQAIAMLESLVR